MVIEVRWVMVSVLVMVLVLSRAIERCSDLKYCGLVVVGARIVAWLM